MLTLALPISYMILNQKIIYFFNFLFYMMKLNRTQRLVFGALNACPQFNDRQLAEALDLKRSTVTVARHFLEKHKLYSVTWVPRAKIYWCQNAYIQSPRVSRD
jgi:hypothetical protein